MLDTSACSWLSSLLMCAAEALILGAKSEPGHFLTCFSNSMNLLYVKQLLNIV